MNYASSSGAAEAVAAEIKSLGGDAIIVGANSGNRDDMERRALAAMDASEWAATQTKDFSHYPTPSPHPPACWVENK